MDKRKLYAQAEEKWETDLQSIMVIEEMSELTKAITKSFRQGTPHESLPEEVADVEIMIEQLKQMFNLEESVEEWKQKKLERLYNMLN